MKYEEFLKEAEKYIKNPIKYFAEFSSRMEEKIRGNCYFKGEIPIVISYARTKTFWKRKPELYIVMKCAFEEHNIMPFFIQFKTEKEMEDCIEELDKWIKRNFK